MRNIDRLRKMDASELAGILVACGCACDCCVFRDDRPEECEKLDDGCYIGVENWLMSEED
jgi:hypothetical protein